MKRSFFQITGDTFGFILQLWQHTTSALMELYQNKDARVLASLELSTLVLKVLRKMVVHGFKVFEPSSQPACLLQTVLEKITIILQYSKYKLTVFYGLNNGGEILGRECLAQCAADLQKRRQRKICFHHYYYSYYLLFLIQIENTEGAIY
ncbi:PREDICTED: uncharacterized protein LOC107344590 [Acropora digitifera]|uniref:uncharacterized protein LOC107344590 n=1 Tax=Acropora digitifera TaxID=70779 RepID=UPI00077B0515|nr:PREDICTED: uncharacterized protein LOC107344590 [Acropora digitifera]